jgi:uncharacterized membrane protein YdbT with pleckstrin-like domain
MNSDFQETVAYRTGCHWIVMLWPLMAGLALGFIGFIVLASGWLMKRHSGSHNAGILEGAIFLIVGGALIARGIIRRITTEVMVSNKRVRIQTGMFSRKSIEVLLSRVESIGMAKTFAGRILGYGTVVVKGIGGTSERFEKIAHPEELQRHVENQLSSLAV